MKSPVKSIRAYCLWCCNGSAIEVKLCTVYSCPFYTYRMGYKADVAKLKELIPKITEEDLKKVVTHTPIKSIRENCRYCSNFEIKEIRDCEHSECACHLFRLGKNPRRKGIGGNTNLIKEKNINSDIPKKIMSSDEQSESPEANLIKKIKLS